MKIQLVLIGIESLMMICGSIMASHAQSFPTISIGVSGNVGSADEYNPITIIYQRFPQHGSKALSFINYHHPKRLEQIQTALNLSKEETQILLLSLRKCGLIRWSRQTGYQVTFAVFDDNVWTVFKPVMSEMARKISSNIINHVMPSLEEEWSNTSFHQAGIPFGIIAMVVIGAFGLDEAAIDTLQQSELIQVTKVQPGGRHYVVLSQANNMSIRFPLYGIHSDEWEAIFYSTFGENGAMNRKRQLVKALPNLVWNWQSDGTQTQEQIAAFTSRLSHVVRHFGNGWFSLNQLSSILQTDSQLSNLLLEKWISHTLIEDKADSNDAYRIAFPVFSAKERRHFENVAKNIAETILEIFRHSYPSLKKAYLKTNPASHNVPIQEVLNLVYHHTYSIAINQMVSADARLRFAVEDGELRYTGYASIE